MNCSDCQNMVLPWLHGLLDDSESVTFGSHLKDCPACTQLVNAEKTRQKQWKGAVLHLPGDGFHSPRCENIGQANQPEAHDVGGTIRFGCKSPSDCRTGHYGGI